MNQNCKFSRTRSYFKVLQICRSRFFSRHDSTFPYSDQQLHNMIPLYIYTINMYIQYIGRITYGMLESNVYHYCKQFSKTSHLQVIFYRWLLYTIWLAIKVSLGEIKIGLLVELSTGPLYIQYQNF